MVYTKEQLNKYRDLCYNRLKNCKGKSAEWYWNMVANNRRLLLE